MSFFFPKNKVCACRTLAPERYAKHYVPHRELHIPAERFCVIRNEVSYYIKKPYLKSPLRYGSRWGYTAEPALQGMEYPAGILIYSICSARADQMQTHS